MKKKLTSSRSYELILPAEWSETLDILTHIRKLVHRYYFILHDSDYDKETGEVIKPHYHALFTYKNPVILSTVVNHFKDFSEKLKENSFNRIRNITGAKRYLVHIDNPEKHQYKPDQVETNDKTFDDLFLEKKSKDEEINIIMNAYENTTAETEREYLEGFRPSFQSMHNTYQMIMASLALKREFREQKRVQYEKELRKGLYF